MARRRSSRTWSQIAHRTPDGRSVSLGQELADDEVVLLDGSGTPAPMASRTTRRSQLSGSARGSRACSPDPVHEGKSMAALIDLGLQSGRIEPGSRVLYAHLGGQPAPPNAYAGAF